VQSIYRDVFLSWAQKGLGGDASRQQLLRALLRGDADTAEALIERWLHANASFIDTARHDPPERFYHGFVLGLLVSLGTRYEVLSNSESGYGRCDLMLLPRAAAQPGLVMELKVRDGRRGETVEQALERAFAQITERDYRARLHARGASPIYEMAVIFDGKRVTARARQA
jgi:hypothetical protein